MDEIKFKGPYKFSGKSSIFDEISSVINGVYLWCIKSDNNSFRVYYVGESVDIKKRMYDHRKNQLEGKYTGHSIDALRKNIRILMHRAGDGMIPRFSKMDRASFNKNLTDNLYLFYSELPTTGVKEDDKWLRCRLESGVVFQIENKGQNIVSVGHLRYWKGKSEEVKVSTGNNIIEALSNETISI